MKVTLTFCVFICLFGCKSKSIEEQKRLALKEYLTLEYEEYFKEARDVLEYKLNENSGFAGLTDLKRYMLFDYKERVEKVWFDEVYDSEYIISIAKGAAIGIGLPYENMGQIMVKPRVNRVRVNFYSFLIDLLFGGALTVLFMSCLTKIPLPLVISPILDKLVKFLISVVVGCLVGWLLSIPIENFAHNMALKCVINDAVSQVVNYL